MRKIPANLPFCLEAGVTCTSPTLVVRPEAGAPEDKTAAEQRRLERQRNRTTSSRETEQ